MKRIVLGLVLLAHLIVPISSSFATTADDECGWLLKAGWVKSENQKIGTREWDKGIPLRHSGDYVSALRAQNRNLFRAIKDPESYRPVQGWFEATSATCGQSVALHLASPISGVTISLYRMGFYQGLGARLISRSRVTIPNVVPITTISTSRTINVAKAWPIGWTFQTNQQTPPGDYLVRLDAKGLRSTFVPITVSSLQFRSVATLLSSAFTWQAYNKWGGYSLYSGPDGKETDRATIQTFDRPYDGDGAGQFRYMEYPLVKIAEEIGIDLNYITDLELNSNTENLLNTDSLVLSGHAEYWTTSMRAAAEKMVAAGISVISLGGNSMYNRPNYDSSSRNLTMWRWSGSVDPHRKDPLLASTAWRKSPIRNPESLFLGSQYLGITTVTDLKISTDMSWPFEKLPRGTVIHNIVGTEVDSPLYSPGPQVESLASADVTVRGKLGVAMSTYYTTESGAGILDIGTNGWVCSIDRVCPWQVRISQRDSDLAREVTKNIFSSLAEGPLGSLHPAHVNVFERNIYFDEWAGIIDFG